MAEKWLTYEELAIAFGIGKESARTLVKRKRWARRMANDGLARIGVPEELIEARTVPQVTPPVESRSDPPSDPPSDPRDAPRRDPPSDLPAHEAVAAALTRHIERLEAQLDEALKRASDRDQIAAQRDLVSAQVEALRGVLDIERQRTEEWRAVADRFATQTEKLTAAQAQRGWWPWRRKA